MYLREEKRKYVSKELPGFDFFMILPMKLVDDCQKS